MKPTSAKQSRVSEKSHGEARELIGMHLSSARLIPAQPVRKSDGLQLLREVTWKKITRTYVPTHLLRTISGSYLLRPETLTLMAIRKVQVTPSAWRYCILIPREAAASHPHAGDQLSALRCHRV
jgi:hypothetical protein